MKWVKGTLVTLVALVVMLFLTGFLLPSELNLTATRTIEADAMAVTNLLATPRTWTSWSPWNQEKMPQMTSTYEGPEAGAGSRWVWKDPEHGDGTLEITEAQPGQSVAYHLRFEGFEPMVGRVSLSQGEAGLEVQWSTTWSTGGSPLWNWMILLMETTMRDEYLAAIAGLDKAAAATK